MAIDFLLVGPKGMFNRNFIRRFEQTLRLYLQKGKSLILLYYFVECKNGRPNNEN